VQKIIISLFFQLIAGLLPLAVLLFGKRRFSTEYVLLLLASVIATTAMLYFTSNNIQNTLIFDGYYFCSIILLTLFYLKNIRSKAICIVIICLGIISILTYSLEIYFLRNPHFGLILNNLSFIIIPILYYVSQLIDNQLEMNDSMILLNTVIFIYYCSSFFLFYFLVSLTKNDLWYIHNIIEGISKLLIAYAFWKLPRQTNSLA
jgi:hypothetical protein